MSEKLSLQKESVPTEKKFPWERLKEVVPNPKVILASLMLLANSPANAQSAESIFSKAGNTLSVLGKEINEATPSGDAYFRFDKENDDGTVQFNPWSILAPVQIEAGYRTPVLGKHQCPRTEWNPK